ncbi:MAG: uncharacterized protein JWM68_1929, partial [Verrucomicrobiales bacterium]|nr:uncharacterized protein [Verrucomicrobiales bacterium]
MNQKQFIKLLLLFLVVGGVGFAVYKRNNSTWKSETTSERKLLPDLDVNAVAQISLKKDENGVTLAKKNEIWVVKERNDYPANFETISDFVQKARDAKVVQTEPIGASQLARMELVPPGKATPSGLAVELKGSADKTLGSFILGKFHVKPTETATAWGGNDGGWPDGRFALVSDKTGTAKLISEPFRETEAKPVLWLNKEFFHIEKAKAIASVSTNAANSWKVARDSETALWKLVDAKPGEQVDTNKLAALNSVMSSAQFTDLAMNPKPEETLLDHPLLVTIETFDNFTYVMKVGRKPGDDHYFTMTVNANISKERTPGKDEKPEDKAKLDKEFQGKAQKLEEKLKQEKRYEGWVYMLPGYNV